MLVILPGVMDVSLAQTSRAMVLESEHIRILRKKEHVYSFSQYFDYSYATLFAVSQVLTA